MLFYTICLGCCFEQSAFHSTDFAISILMEALKLLHYYKLIVSASIYELPHNTELIGTNWLNGEGTEAQTDDTREQRAAL